MNADDRVEAATRRPVWLTAPVLTVSVLTIAAGMGQFAVTAVIGDVAARFDVAGAESTDLAEIGVPASALGVALAVIRLTSLASLPVAALADRLGRRRVLLMSAAFGLALTSLAAAAPGFWWFVALVALARPALSAVNAVAGVVAAEEATARDRSAAIALLAAAYGVGAGVVAIGRGLLPGDAPSFRIVMAFTLVPLLLLPVLARRIREPRIARRRRGAFALPGAIPRVYVGRVALMALLTAAITVATGPGFTYLFVYGEGVLDASPLFLSTLVLGAGPAGLVGILVGRFGADRLGRTPTSGLAMAATGFAVAYAYSGGITQLATGYLLAIATSSAFAPAMGALVAELVTTRVRATVAGWETIAGVLGAVVGLMSFGLLAELTGGFAAAARSLGIAVAAAAIGFWWLPETRGTELDVLEA